MKIIQVLPTLAYGDAIGNDTFSLASALKEMGYIEYICAENIDPRVAQGIVYNKGLLNELEEEDLVIYHLSTGTMLSYEVAKLKCKKIVIYHNITPPEFFKNYSETAYRLCVNGRNEAGFLSDKIDYCLADSSYNMQDLRNLGFECKIDVLPILIKFSDYDLLPNENIVDKYSKDEYVNIVFVGRIAPNKKHEDVIAAFHYYQKYYNDKSRLFLVGNWEGMEIYYSRLSRYIEKLGVKNVIFTGHIPFDEILGYYQIADLFLCMSEHEGFCVPLVEAMYFGIPIVAYDCTAVGETMGNSGVLLKEKDPLETAGIIDYIMNNGDFKEYIVQNQKERMDYFSNDDIKSMFKKYIEEYIAGIDKNIME